MSTDDETTALTLTDIEWLAGLSAKIRDYLVANDMTSRAGFHAGALTHRLADRLAAERARTAEVKAEALREAADTLRDLPTPDLLDYPAEWNAGVEAAIEAVERLTSAEPAPDADAAALARVRALADPDQAGGEGR